ncbi:hypothetical protein SP19_39 [Salmonella phage 19]|nr:hypothetical protein SP19_39 [Salmonella phage 19]
MIIEWRANELAERPSRSDRVLNMYTSQEKMNICIRLLEKVQQQALQRLAYGEENERRQRITDKLHKQERVAKTWTQDHGMNLI